MGPVRDGRRPLFELLLRLGRDARPQVCARVLKQHWRAQGVPERVAIDLPLLLGEICVQHRHLAHSVPPAHLLRVRPLQLCLCVCVWQNGEKQETIVGSNIPAIHEYIKANAPKNES